MPKKVVVEQSESLNATRLPPVAAGNRAERRHPQQDAGGDSLPLIGRGRWGQFARFVGVSREQWRKLSLAGRAPAPLRMGARCSLYSFSEVHSWIADPANYQAKEAK